MTPSMPLFPTTPGRRAYRMQLDPRSSTRSSGGDERGSVRTHEGGHMRHGRWLGVVLALGLVAAACGRSGSEGAGDTGSGVSPTTATANATCEGTTLEATDTGVTADTITIQVMADTGSALAPGLFQGNI